MPASRLSIPHLDDLVAQVVADLRRRLEAGDQHSAADILAAHPSLACRPPLAARVVLAEIEARRARGETPDPGRYLTAYPHLAEELKSSLGGGREPQATPGAPVETPRRRDGLPSLGSTIGAPIADEQTGAPAQLSDLIDLAALYEKESDLPVTKGGMGVVFRAHDRVLGAVVAIKEIRNERPSATDVTRFFREARAAAGLRHPNIVAVTALGRYEGRLAFVMPFIPGGSLKERRGEFRAPESAAWLIGQVARGVGAAHAAGIVHRDLKPANVLLDDAGRPLVADFGLARLLDGGEEVTQPGQVVGTPAYMSPEQALGTLDAVGPASDVWALGVMLHELLVGTRPVGGVATLAGVPAGLARVVRRCLERDPGDRYPDGAAVADDLDRWLRGQPVSGPPRRPRRAWPRVLGGLIGVVIPALIVAGWWRHQPSPEFAPEPLGFLAASEPSPADLLKAAHEQLRAGQPVDLLALTPLHRWPLEPGAPANVRDGVLSLESFGSLPLELLPDPGLTSYRLEVEIKRHQGITGYAGVYVRAEAGGVGSATWLHLPALLYNETTQRPPGHTFTYLRFDAHPGPAGYSREEGDVLVARPEQPRVASAVALTAGGGYHALDGLRLAPRPRWGLWRTLYVDVSPAGVVATWDGFQAMTLSAAEAQRQSQMFAAFRGAPQSPATLPLRGPIGLYVQTAAADFRNVRLRPLPGP